MSDERLQHLTNREDLAARYLRQVYQVVHGQIGVRVDPISLHIALELDAEEHAGVCTVLRSAGLLDVTLAGVALTARGKEWVERQLG